MSNPKQFSSLQPAQHKKASRVDDPALPPVIDTLPDVVGDDQENVVSAAQQLNGLPVTVRLWPNAAEFPGEFDRVEAYIDNSRVHSQEFEGPLTDDIDILINSPRLRSHGPKVFTYSVTLFGGPNGATSDPITVFVDAIDPNGNNRPGAILLPANLPSEGVTPAYLAANGGVTLTLSRPVDSRPGDTFIVFFGVNDLVGTTGVVPFPATDPITITYTTAQVMVFGPGDHLITFQFIDRAGNATQISTSRTLTVKLSDPPVMLAPQIPEAAPLVVKEEARGGVLVTVGPITNFQPNDHLHIFWNGIEFGDRRIGPLPIFDFEFMADYPTIAAGGTLYTATVNYEIRRGGDTYNSPDTTVNVDLVEPGTGIIGPGPVDTALVLPLVRGDSATDNSLVPSDLDGTIHATFTIYAGHAAAEFIDLYYGTGEGDIADTYPVTGLEAPTFVVPMTIPRALVEKYGNGSIPCWYRVRNANNYKQSLPQAVRVEVFMLDGLAAPVFTNLFRGPFTAPPPFNAPYISCSQAPWLGVPIRIFDPATLKDGDVVTIHAVRYEYTGAVQPALPVAGSATDSPPIGIGPNERISGFTHNFILPYFDGDISRRRGWVEVTWSISRTLPVPEKGTSDPVVHVWDVRSSAAGGTCSPGPIRRRGSLT